MKKITIGLLLMSVACMNGFGQDFKKVKNAFTLYQISGNNNEKLEEAKNELEKVLADPKSAGKVESYLLSTEIYGSIAGNDALKAKNPGAAQKGLASLKKYLALEPGAEKFKEDNYIGINAIYNYFFDKGYNFFKEKSWDSAFLNFKPMVEMGDIMVKNKWTNSLFDTTAYKLAGISAQNANRDDDAIYYYERMASLKLKGEDLEHIYVYLPQLYSKRKNEQEFKKHIALGREIYPEKPWDQLEFDYISDNLTMDEISKKFDEDLSANRLSSSMAMNYGDYFINDKKVKELKPEEKRPFIEKGSKAFAKAYELDPKNILAAYNAGVTNYVLWGETDDAAIAIKGVTPEIKAKRAQADKVAMAAYEKAAESLEKAYKLLDESTTKSSLEKNSEKNAAKFLANLYMWKRDKSKGKATEYDLYDKKFQNYDKKY